MRSKIIRIGNQEIEAILMAGGNGFKIYGGNGKLILWHNRKHEVIEESDPRFKIVMQYVNLKYQPLDKQEKVKEEFMKVIKNPKSRSAKGKKKYEIIDWASNEMFGGKQFDSFEEAWGFLYEKFDHLPEKEFNEEMGEYEVVEVGSVRKRGDRMLHLKKNPKSRSAKGKKHRLTEKDILHERGPYWVANEGNAYTVVKNLLGGRAESDSSYPHTEDGLSIAKARVDYLARKDQNKNPLQKRIEVWGASFMKVMDDLEKLGEPAKNEKILVVGDDEYVVMKAVGYLENRGWLVSWKIRREAANKNPKSRSAKGKVPHSELAMHTKIAGKEIEKYEIINDRLARVWVVGDSRPVDGLHSEVLSWEIRENIAANKNPKYLAMDDSDHSWKELLLDEAHGIYIPQMFAQNFDMKKWHVHFSDEKILLLGPDAVSYWDAWDNVLRNAYFIDPKTKKKWYLEQDGDLFAVLR